MQKILLAIGCFLMFSRLANAQEFAVKISQAEQASVIEKVHSIKPNWQVVAVEKSPLKGFYRVDISGGETIYFSSENGYFFQGPLLQHQDNSALDITENNARKKRLQLITDIALESTIIYRPKGEVKAVVYAFIDVDCGACRDLHQQIPAINELGIEVRYLAYPRAGLQSQTYQKMTSAWCAKQPKEALEDLMINTRSPLNLCAQSPVAEHYKLGQLMGLRGTPGIILANGSLLHGYKTANELARVILASN